jgi:methylsterol monooxygenase
VHLNLAEKAWAAWHTYMQNDVLATGIMSFAMHKIVYFERSLLWIIADRLPYFNKYKIQNVRPTGNLWLHLLTSFEAKNSHTRRAMELHQSRPAVPLYRRTTTNLAFPPSRAVLWPFDKCASPLNFTTAYQIAISFVLEDTWHYWPHRALHTPSLYKMIHKIHHQYSAPLVLPPNTLHPSK